MESESSKLGAGDKIRLVGLVQRPDLNGKHGCILAKSQQNRSDSAQLSDGRYAVLLQREQVAGIPDKPKNLDKPGFFCVKTANSKFKVKRDNLQLLEPAIVRLHSAASMSLERGGDPVVDSFDSAYCRGDTQRVQIIFECVKSKLSGKESFAAADFRLNADGQTPLHISILEGAADMVDLCIEYGANVNAKFGPRRARWALQELACLHSAIIALQLPNKSQSREQIVLSLINAGADVNQPTASRGNPLLMVLEHTNSFSPELRFTLTKALLA